MPKLNLEELKQFSDNFTISIGYDALGMSSGSVDISITQELVNSIRPLIARIEKYETVLQVVSAMTTDPLIETVVDEALRDDD